MNYKNTNFNEEKKKQNTQSEYGANIQSDYGPKPFTNNQNNSIFKMTGSPNKNLKATANMYNNQIVKNNYDNPTVKKDADYLNNPQTVKQNTATNSNYNQIIPKEKKEQERLQRITGIYDLRKADQSEVRKHIKLKEKRPDDYYRYDSTMDSKESKRRLDEVFGPKTDFSIWNFENNYDKMNLEEQEMLVHKMQSDFNIMGYRDSDGYRLKTDGKYGNKTKAVYEQYKKDNKEDYDDYNEFKKQEDKGYSILTDDNRKPIYFASVDNDLSGVITKQSNNKDNVLNYTQNESVPSLYEIILNSPKAKKLRNEYGITKNTSLREVKEKKGDKIIIDNSNYIIDAAKEFGVNPGILGATIYTEQVENVDVLDYYLDNFGGKIGLDTSIGLSQVKLSTAKMLEDNGYMPKIAEDKADGKTEKEKRIEALEDPKTNIRYAAAYLKYFQDRWKKQYPEIDGRTAILATLYNIGHNETSPHPNPLSNDFGETAKSYYHHINYLLDIE